MMPAWLLPTFVGQSVAVAEASAERLCAEVAKGLRAVGQLASP